jgi:four helix bundle protein
VSRDHRKLHVFQIADDLVPRIYNATKDFPVEERFGLQAQLRRAAVSVACNIVEGSARRSGYEYLNFLNIAAGSATEARYLVELSNRLGFVSEGQRDQLMADYTKLIGSLQSLSRALGGSVTKPAVMSPKP